MIFTFVVAVIGLVLSYFIGGLEAVYLTAILAILEVSLSFDNAVVNAKILQSMDEVWQKRFLTWGMLIAVFGMRFLFPILIVSIAAGISIVKTVDLAFFSPDEYHNILLNVENLIYAFGGAFLLMVFFDFIFNENEVKWIKPVENVTQKFGKVENISLIVSMIVGIIITYDSQKYEVAIAYFLGVLTYSLLNSLSSISSSNIKNGMMGFLYLEVLDASFSFDGVIGAFAITSNIILIMIGLGIGAMFVRALTILFVKKGVLSEYKYLEHGAHYAIGVLAVIMLLKLFFHISEEITGTLGLGLLILAFLHSKFEKK